MPGGHARNTSVQGDRRQEQMNALTTTSPRRVASLSGRLALVFAPLIVSAAVATVAAWAAPASAAAPELLLTVPSESQVLGGGADQLDDPTSVVANPQNGHIYVAEQSNKRVSEFTAWGSFVKTWGWGVVASGPDDKPRNAVQQVNVDATAGSFALSFDFRGSDGYLRPGNITGVTETGPIAFDASASAVQAVLLSLPDFEPGDVLVSGPAGGPWTIEYAGYYSDFDMPLPRVVHSTLTGGSATATPESLQKGANAEVCVPANGDVCQSGQSARASSAGPGQVDTPVGTAVDSAGNVYVREAFEIWESSETSVRVQKFDPAGKFLLMFGGDVNKTTGADVCTKADLEAGQECGRGVAGSGPSEFAAQERGGLAYDSLTDTLLAGDLGRIEEFHPDGTFKGEIPFTGSLEAFKGKAVEDLAVDSAGDIYFSIAGLSNVYKIGASGEPLAPGLPGSSSFAVENPGNVAVDSQGDVYAIGSLIFGGRDNVYEFNAAGEKLLPGKAEEESGQLFPSTHSASLLGIATNLCAGSEAPGDLYLTYFEPGGIERLSYLNVFGTPPIGCEPPPSVPPVISAQYVTVAGGDFAQLRAQINPHFFSNTTYYLEYGTGKCSEGGCDRRAPLVDAQLTNKVLNEPLTTASIALSGLQPATIYHYRFVADSGGGGPVYGIDPDGEAGPGQASQTEGGEGAFRTFTPPTPAAPCPANEALRAGAALPDCRAYELVSPLEKHGGSPGLLPSTMSFFEVNQSSSDGNRVTYSAMSAFADPESAPYISQYLSTRDPSTGWTTESISPPRTTRPLNVQHSLINEFEAFSPDLCQAWLVNNSDSTLAPGAIAGFPNLYRRANCQSTPAYEALTTVRPPEEDPSLYMLYPLGFSANGAEAAFLANDRLSPDAPALPIQGEEREFFLYVNGPGGLRYACYLPNGKPISTACSAGMVADQPNGRASAVQGALSADGTRLYWTAYEGNPVVQPKGIPGTIYVRLNPDEPQSKVSAGKCTEPANACTLAVSGLVTPEKSEFWAASRDGSKAFFRVARGPLAGNLYQFDLATKASTLIAEGVENPMAVSDDGSRVYFASTKLLGQGESEGAKAGAHNLYLYEAGAGFSFIMRLTGHDLGGSEGRPGAVSEVPTERSSVLSADGAVAAFVSNASPTPTGYDNTDAVSGQPDQEVYRYDAESHQLRCVSCNPTGARPLGTDAGSYGEWAAAQLPEHHAALVAAHPLSSDGKRLFFESHEALVPRDTDGTWDVYEWEVAGIGSCTESTSTYNPDTGGCVELISSGSSAEPSRFLDADPSGENVFIGTFASLIAADYGLPDVYDARVDGGFPEPPGLPAACEGEACQGPFTPPGDATPASSVFQGSGDIPAAPGAKATPKAKAPTRAQKLARALKACHRRHGKARKRCVAQARKRFGKAKGARKRMHSSSRRAGR